MTMFKTRRRFLLARRSVGAAVTATTLVLAGAAGPAAAASGPSTAWSEGRFHVDVPGVVGRSDVVLGQPNPDPLQAMPLGNGGLGAAVWSANALTAQLNRADTLPDRLSPGQLTIPGLAALTGAGDYRGRLDLYDGLHGGPVATRSPPPRGCSSPRLAGWTRSGAGGTTTGGTSG